MDIQEAIRTLSSLRVRAPRDGECNSLPSCRACSVNACVKQCNLQIEMPIRVGADYLKPRLTKDWTPDFDTWMSPPSESLYWT
jgi:hypothetical protein